MILTPFLNHILKFHFWIPSYSPVPLTLTFKAIWLLASDFPEITFNVALGQQMGDTRFSVLLFMYSHAPG